jgi:predicted aconitase with swiveling domain
VPAEAAAPEDAGPARAFKEWTLTPAEASYARGDLVWAAAVDAEGRWMLAGMRFVSKNGDVLHLDLLGDYWAPSAFVRSCPPAGEFAAGALVLMRHGTGSTYGKVARVEGENVFVNYLPSPTVTERQLQQGGAVPLVAGEWALGAPAAIRDEVGWLPVTVVRLEGDTVYVSDGNGVRPMPKADVHLIDFATERRVGAKVLALKYSGFAPLCIVPAKITEVLADGAAFSVKTEEGKIWTQSFAWIMTPPET